MSDGIPLISSPLPLSSARVNPGWGRCVPALAWLSRCRQEWPLRPITERYVALFSEAVTESDLCDAAEGSEHTADSAQPAGEGASSREEVLRSLCQDTAQLHIASSDGRKLADGLIDSGAQILIPALCGERRQVTALIGAVSNTEPVALVDPLLGVESWQEEVAELRRLMFSVRTDHADPYTMLKKVEAPLVREMMEFIQQAALRKTPMLIDSPSSLLATLLAERITPGVRQWTFLADAPDSPATRAVTEELVMTPMNNVGITMTEGAGALSALRLLDSIIEAENPGELAGAAL